MAFGSSVFLLQTFVMNAWKCWFDIYPSFIPMLVYPQSPTSSSLEAWWTSSTGYAGDAERSPESGGRRSLECQWPFVPWATPTFWQAQFLGPWLSPTPSYPISSIPAKCERCGGAFIRSNNNKKTRLFRLFPLKKRHVLLVVRGSFRPKLPCRYTLAQKVVTTSN